MEKSELRVSSQKSAYIQTLLDIVLLICCRPFPLVHFKSKRRTPVDPRQQLIKISPRLLSCNINVIGFLCNESQQDCPMLFFSFSLLRGIIHVYYQAHTGQCSPLSLSIACLFIVKYSDISDTHTVCSTHSPILSHLKPFN